VTGDRRKLRNDLRDLYSSSSIIRMVTSRRMSWAGHIARIGAKRNVRVYGILVGKPEGKGRPRRSRPRCVYNSKLDLRGIRLGGMDWIHFDRNRNQLSALVSTVMNPQVPYNIEKCLSNCTIDGF
jgi:hypothetical protein